MYYFDSGGLEALELTWRLCQQGEVLHTDGFGPPVDGRHDHCRGTVALKPAEILELSRFYTNFFGQGVTWEPSYFNESVEHLQAQK